MTSAVAASLLASASPIGTAAGASRGEGAPAGAPGLFAGLLAAMTPGVGPDGAATGLNGGLLAGLVMPGGDARPPSGLPPMPGDAPGEAPDAAMVGTDLGAGLQADGVDEEPTASATGVAALLPDAEAPVAVTDGAEVEVHPVPAGMTADTDVAPPPVGPAKKPRSEPVEKPGPSPVAVLAGGEPGAVAALAAGGPGAVAALARTKQDDATPVVAGSETEPVADVEAGDEPPAASAAPADAGLPVAGLPFAALAGDVGPDETESANWAPVVGIDEAKAPAGPPNAAGMAPAGPPVTDPDGPVLTMVPAAPDVSPVDGSRTAVARTADVDPILETEDRPVTATVAAVRLSAMAASGTTADSGTMAGSGAMADGPVTTTADAVAAAYRSANGPATSGPVKVPSSILPASDGDEPPVTGAVASPSAATPEDAAPDGGRVQVTAPVPRAAVPGEPAGNLQPAADTDAVPATVSVGSDDGERLAGDSLLKTGVAVPPTVPETPTAPGAMPKVGADTAPESGAEGEGQGEVTAATPKVPARPGEVPSAGPGGLPTGEATQIDLAAAAGSDAKPDEVKTAKTADPEEEPGETEEDRGPEKPAPTIRAELPQQAVKPVAGVGPTAQAFVERLKGDAAPGKDGSADPALAVGSAAGSLSQVIADAAGARGQPQHQPAPTVPPQAVGMEIARRVSAGETAFQIRLNPEDLGRIDVRLEFTESGEARAHIQVERREAYEILKHDQKTIERTLREAGFETKDNSVSLSMRQDGGGNGERMAQNQQQRQDGEGRYRSPVEVLQSSDTEAAAPVADLYRPRRDALVDVRL